MKYIISVLTILSVLLSNNFTVSSKPIEYEISASTYDELMEKIKTYSFNLLNDLANEFTIILTGEYVESLIYDEILESQTEFETPLINSYINSNQSGYNSLILRKYTISKTAYKSSLISKNVKKIKINYQITWSEQLLDKTNVYTFTKTISDSILTGQSDDYTKILTIHNYITDNFEYDTTNSAENYVHTPSEMIRLKYGVCSAYTGLLTAFLDINNIENRVVIKDAYSSIYSTENSSHAWNMAKINGFWYHIDATWDDPITSIPLKVQTLKYFLVSDEVMKKDHSWDINVYPTCDISYNDNKKTQATLPVLNVVDKKIKTENNKTSLTDLSSSMFTQKLFDIIFNINFIIGLCGVICFVFIFIFSVLQRK